MLKKVVTDKYAIIFNPATGMEITSGINGYKDPVILDAPSLLDIGIMGTCNNRCEFCYQGDVQQPNMTIDDYKSIIIQVKDCVMQVALGGRGNPDEHPDFAEILEFTRENGVVPNYTTAGNTMSPLKASLSKKYCGAVAVSDYDMPYTYKAIKMLQAVGVKTNIHFVLTADRVERALDLLLGRDIWCGQVDVSKLNAVVFLLFKPMGRGKEHPEWGPMTEQLRQFISSVRSPKVPFKLGMDSCLVNKIKALDNLTKMEAICMDTCEAARCSCYISPDMLMSPCSFVNSPEYKSKVKLWGIDKIWNGIPFKSVRIDLIKKPAKCPFEL